MVQDLPPAFLGPVGLSKGLKDADSEVGLYAWQSESSSEETASESSQVLAEALEPCFGPRITDC